MSDRELCFYCAESAAYVGYGALTRENDQTFEDIIRDGVGEAVRGKIQVRAAACEEHEDALIDAICEVFGTTSDSERLNQQPEDECLDPFHDGDSDGEVVRTVHPAFGWESEHYRCPTCGFESMTSRPCVPEDDPAYMFALAAFRKVVPA